MVASTFLLAGLGSVMLIARQVAYTPSAAVRRTQAAEVVNQLADEICAYATLILQQTPRILEFVVTDRNSDNTAEKIRYEWSGTLGDPLYKTMNGGTAVPVLLNVQQFQLDYTTVTKTTPVTATVDSTEGTLVSLSAGTTTFSESITTTNWLAQHIDPQSFPASVGGINKSSATGWNATRVDFQGTNALPFTVGLRETGETNGPTNVVLNKVDLATANANMATFSPAIRGLSFARKYAVVFRSEAVTASRLTMKNIAGARTAFRTADREVSWQLYPDRQAICTVYGTYTALGIDLQRIPQLRLARPRLALRAGKQSHARIDASMPLVNLPEVLAAYWRTDFDVEPHRPRTRNGDGVSRLGPSTAAPSTRSRSSPASGRQRSSSKRGRCTISPPSQPSSPLPQHHGRRQRRSAANQCRPPRRPIRAAARLRATTIRRHANTHALRQIVRRQHDATVRPLAAVERLRPLPAHDPAAEQRREPARSTAKTKAHTLTRPTHHRRSTDRFLTLVRRHQPAEFDYIEVG